MPLKLIPPKEGRSKVYRVRGTHRGVYVDRSTGIGAGEKRAEARAKALLEGWRSAIESGELTGTPPLTFDAAATAFITAGGDDRFLEPILKHFGTRTTVAEIDQAAVDKAAAELYPKATPATRNRQVYTPISAILRHNNLGFDMKRPKGSQGERRLRWLSPHEFERVATEAGKLDQQLAAMMVVGCYTGMRLGEILALRGCDINLESAEAVVLRTKNGDPRLAYLPPRVCAALVSLPGGIQDTATRLFRFTRNQKLNDLAHKAYTAAGVDCGGAPFHILRHTWATWMVRAGADLVATKAWRSQTAARGYSHFVVSEEARKANELPGAVPLLSVRNPGE